MIEGRFEGLAAAVNAGDLSTYDFIEKIQTRMSVILPLATPEGGSMPHSSRENQTSCCRPLR